MSTGIEKTPQAAAILIIDDSPANVVILVDYLDDLKIRLETDEAARRLNAEQQLLIAKLQAARSTITVGKNGLARLVGRRHCARNQQPHRVCELQYGFLAELL